MLGGRLFIIGYLGSKKKAMQAWKLLNPGGRLQEQAEQQKKSEPKSLKCTRRIQTGAKGGWRMN
jgi:hypothetical protein